MRARQLSAGRDDERGAALVEFAITGIFFLTLVLGVIEASRAIYHYNIVASIARDGTRFAAVRGSQSGRVASVDDVRAYVRGRSLGLNPTVNVSWTPNNNPGGTVQVQVQSTFTTIVPLPMVPNATLTSTARAIVLR